MCLSIVLISLLLKNAFGANILFISPIEYVSHHIWSEVLIQSLLEKGHNITLLGYNDAKIKSENYTVLKMPVLSNVNDALSEINDHSNPITDLIRFWHCVMVYVEPHLNSDELKLLLNYPKSKFDLIIFDLFSGQEFYPLIEYFGNPPVVGTSPFGLPPYILDTMGSHFYFYYPIYNRHYTDNMTLLQRIENTFLYLLEYFLKNYYMLSQYKMAQTRYGVDITPFDQMEQKIGILLANYDPVLDFGMPLSPNIIPVGGMHVRRSEKLPSDLKEILDKANDGIILFSFGTIVEPSRLPMEKKKLFLNVFSKLNQTILWKYTADDLKNVPNNVIIRKRYPQNDVLAHENVKLFITHSGALSSHEAIYHGIPVITVPFFADQKVIAKKMATRGLGKRLLMSEITEDLLYENILEVINNPIYKQNMQKISRIFRDQKETPLERATFWVEYALRNKNLSHLSSKSRNMTLFQRENLDVYCFILLLVIIFLVPFIWIIKFAVSCFICGIKHEIKIKQN